MKQMLILEKMNAVQAKADKILADKEKELKKLNERIAETRAKITEADAALQQATVKSDTDAYIKAKNDRAYAADALEMLEHRLADLEKKPLLTEEEYNAAIKDVTDDITTACEETKGKLADLAGQMSANADELRVAMDSANALLSTLQEKIYLNADRSLRANGKILMVPQEDKRVNFWDIINWGKAAAKHYQYELYTNGDSER